MIEEPKPKRTRRFVSKVPQEPGVAGFGPAMPTCGNDLIGLWELPQEAIKGARLKIARTIPMSQKLELVRDCTVQDYSMESIAHSFGAGEYQIILNPGPMGAWKGKSARLSISTDYARECGFSVYQEPAPAPAPPRFSELRSLRETAQAIETGQGFTMEKMAGLMETMIERVAERMKPAAPPPDPLAGMSNMLQIMNLMRGEQERSVEMALKMMNLRGPGRGSDDDDDEGDSWPSVIREAIPAVTQALSAMTNRGPAPAQTIEPEPNPEESAVSVPLSQDEIRHFAPAVAMLKPYAGMVKTVIDKARRGEDAAPDLASFIPVRMHPLMIEFSEVTKARGPQVLAILAPELATEKAAACIVQIGKILREV